VPLTGRSLWDAANQFREHINTLLARTITATPVLVVGTRTSPIVEIAFRRPDRAVALAKLGTNVGQMWLSFGQTCDAVEEARAYRLRTVKYKYTLTPGTGHDELPAEGTEPILRWEYVREPPEGKRWCRHHLQGPVSVALNRETRTLNDLHVPTGYVPFEDIIRFCIVDLGVASESDDWDRLLRESYALFKTQFTQ
jgi:hypothetical protein